MSTNLTDLANKYFSTINSIANKIQLDINETKLSYEHIWDKLNITDQIDIINETIIKPEISLRYFDQIETDNDDNDNEYNDMNNSDDNNDDENTKNIYMFDGKNLSTYTSMKTGRKILQDDIIGIYRDEHSAPFNVKTKSQLNLNLLKINNNNNNNNNNNSNNKLIKIRPSSIMENTKDITNKTKNHKYKKIINDDDEKLIQNDGKNPNSSTTDYRLSQILMKNNQKIIKEIEASVGGNNTINVGWKKNKNDKEEEEEKLVSSTSFGINSLSSTAQSDDDDDDDKNYEEANCLLENTDIRKGYDFLANW